MSHRPSEDETLARAQAELERRRAGLDQERLDCLRGRGGIGNVAAALGSGLAAAEVQLVGACPCGGKLARPAPAALALCPSCLSREAEVERRRGLLERIPERYRWADLSRPLVPPGGVEFVVPDAARFEAQAWLDDASKRVLTITAEVADPDGRWHAQTGAGKSSLAGAVAHAAAMRGIAIEWVPARELDPTQTEQDVLRDALARVARAELLVIDGLGKELGGAGNGAGDGVATQRKAEMMRLLGKMYDWPTRRWVFTVDMTSGPLRAAYGNDAFRRIARAPDVIVIRVQRVGDLDYKRF